MPKGLCGSLLNRTFTAYALDTFDCEGKIALGQLCHKSQSIKPKLHFQTGIHSIKGIISKCYKGLKWTSNFFKDLPRTFNSWILTDDKPDIICVTIEKSFFFNFSSI